jgi:hypothetical protein
LINYATGFIQHIGIDPTVAQFHGLAERVQMINEVYGRVLAAQQS